MRRVFSFNPLSPRVDPLDHRKRLQNVKTRAFVSSMKTKQPEWQFIANLGDASPLDFGGLFVYVDKTGAYDPECVRLERITSDETTGKAERWEVRRFICERCTFVNGVLSDNASHPEIAAWFAKPESERAERPQDTTYLSNLVTFSGMTDTRELVDCFRSPDPIKRAIAWEIVGYYHGFDNLDAYPQTLTRKDLYRRYRTECFPRSVRRVSRKPASSVSSGEIGPFAIATI